MSTKVLLYIEKILLGKLQDNILFWYIPENLPHIISAFQDKEKVIYKSTEVGV